MPDNRTDSSSSSRRYRYTKVLDNRKHAIRGLRRRNGKPPAPWQEIEVRNALRLKALRKEITPAEMQASLEAFDEDILSGRWKTPEYKEATVWKFARELSDRHAETIGCRTLDLLHV